MGSLGPSTVSVSLAVYPFALIIHSLFIKCLCYIRAREKMKKTRENVPSKGLESRRDRKYKKHPKPSNVLSPPAHLKPHIFLNRRGLPAKMETQVDTLCLLA